MKHLLILSFSLFATSVANAQTATHDARIDYIKAFKGIAQREMESDGIPASIKLAQAILESNAGQSTLAREANNHFGIKCHSTWNGKTYYITDDDKDASGNLIQSCFRKYKKAEDSFEDHTEFLRDPKKYNRYGFLFNLDRRDYRSWAYGLQSAGYATASTYAESLIRIIEQYQLNEYDTALGNGEITSTPGGTNSGPNTSTDSRRKKLGSNNDIKAIRASSGETIQDLARRYGLSPTKVVCYNDCQIPVTQTLAENEIIYLANKRKKWRGRSKEHFVKKDETMFQIAQQYGIKLMSLYELNSMNGGTEPMTGERIKIKGRKKKDGIKVRTDIAIKPPVVTQVTKPGQPATPQNPTTTPTKTDASTYKPTDELFEIGEGGVTDATKPKPTTDRPTTTGTPRPDAPPPTVPTSTTGNTQTTPSQPPVVTPIPLEPAPPGYHRVAKGDTLYNLSKKYNLTVAQLQTLNGMQTNDIKIGQLLKVK
jgi:LysM repeat protein